MPSISSRIVRMLEIVSNGGEAGNIESICSPRSECNSEKGDYGERLFALSTPSRPNLNYFFIRSLTDRLIKIGLSAYLYCVQFRTRQFKIRLG